MQVPPRELDSPRNYKDSGQRRWKGASNDSVPRAALLDRFCNSSNFVVLYGGGKADDIGYNKADKKFLILSFLRPLDS